MTELDDLLEQATDRVETPGLGHRALVVARRRRRNRRAGLAASAAAVVVVGVVAAVGWTGGAADDPQPAPPAPVEPTPTSWDLRDVADLPAADPAVASLLPDRIDVPDLAPHVEDDPVDAAVLSVDDGADVLLLGTDGKWRCVVVPGKSQPAPVLSPSGTRLVVATTDGLVTVDLATGVQSPRSLPDGYVPTRNRGIVMGWSDEQRLVLVDRDGRGWLVDVVDGSETQVEIPPSTDGGWVLGMPSSHGPKGWTVRPIAQLADGTGLLEVARGPRGQGEWWVVHWDPATDAMTLVSTARANAPKPTSYAYGQLGP